MQLSYQRNKVTKRKNKEQSYIWYLFLIPTFIGIILFMLYPVLESFRLSFFMSNGVNEKFIGFENYTQLIFEEEGFWKAIKNTFYMGIFQLIIAIPLGFIIASLINNLSRFKDLFKVLFFIPYITSLVAASMVFMFLFHPEMGPVNYLLESIGLPAVSWLAAPSSARWAVIILGIWNWLGFAVVICIANLQTIPAQLYEAAEIDGATSIKKWLYITIPKMYPTFTFLLIMGWIRTLQRFAETYTLGGLQGSPARSLYTIVGFIYERGFGGMEFGLASAASYILFILILIVTLINMRLSKMEM